MRPKGGLAEAEGTAPARPIGIWGNCSAKRTKDIEDSGAIKWVAGFKGLIGQPGELGLGPRAVRSQRRV